MKCHDTWGKAGRWVFAATACAVLAAVTGGSAGAGVIFSDDFEGPTLLTGDSPPGQWSWASELGGTVSLAALPSPVFDGSQSCLLDWDGGNGVNIRTPDWAGQTELYCRLYLLIHDWSAGNTLHVFRLFADHPTLGDVLCTVSVVSNGSVLIAQYGPAGNPSNGWGTYPGGRGNTALVEDRWYCIELHYRHCTAAGNNDGRVTVRLNGNVEIDVVNLDTSDGSDIYPAIFWHLGGWAAISAEVYYDNVSVSDAAIPQTLEVLSPVPGTQWADGSVHEIGWMTGDTVEVPNVRIELSRDNGTSWEDIIASTPNDGAYSWNVDSGMLPLPQAQCFIRISDALDGSPSDTSSAFSILGPFLVLTNPGAGDEWGTAGTRTIEWSTEGPIDTVDVLLSRDAGTTWETIETGVANSDSYTWAVDDGGQSLPQNGCIIRIRDYDNPGTYGDSGTFTIAVPWMTVTQPAGGESWAGGTAQEILWSSNLGPTNAVSIAVSYDGGAKYQILTSPAGTANDGLSFFGVPDRPTDQAVVRVSFDGVSAESGVFTITPQDYSVAWADGFESGTVPGAWDSYATQDQSEILVDTSNPAPYAGTYRAEIHFDNTGAPVGDNSTSTRLSKRVFPNGRACCAVRSFMLLESYALEDYVALQFDISGGGSLAVFNLGSQNGEMILSRGQDANPLGWSAPDNDNAGIIPADSSWHRVDVWYKLSTVDGAVDGIMRVYIDGTMTGEATGLDTWDAVGTIHRAEIVRLGGWTGVSQNIDLSTFFDDVSVSTSEPGGPYLTVLAPSGGEEWLVGDTAGITWHVTDKVERDITHVDIEISRDNGATWAEAIALNVDVATDPNVTYDPVTDSYTYTWASVTDGGLPTVPPQVECLTRVSETGGTASDECDSNFSIGERIIEVLAPNGGEEWGTGTDRQITWNCFGIGLLNVRLSRDGGTSYTTIWTCDATDGSYVWTVTGPAAAQCLILIEDAGTPAFFDESDAVFSIVIPTVDVVAPNGGEVFNVSDTEDVTWTCTGLANVRIQLSRDGGVTWEEIAASTDGPAAVYAWEVTGPFSETCRVRVSDIDGTPSGLSDAVFSIRGVDLTAPDGGESWDVGSTQTITWVAHSTTAQIDIELSRNGGTDWETIDTSVDATLGTYDWVLTAPGSDQCVVRISSSAGGYPSDQSEDVFTVAALDLTSPDGGEVWSIGKTSTIEWVQAGAPTVLIELSRDGNWVNGDGSDVETIVADADGQAGSYVWAVSGGASGICLVKISSGALQDESAKVFWIINPSGDTDGDGYTDKEEVDRGSNPFDRNDWPLVLLHGGTGCGLAVADGSFASFLLILFLALTAWFFAGRRKRLANVK